MNRVLSSCFFLIAAGLVAAACSPSVSVAFDPRECALYSACLYRPGQSIGAICEQLDFVDAVSGTPAGAALGIDGPAIACANRATTCAEITACLIATPAQVALCAGSSTPQCSGSVIVQCDGTVSPQALDCASIGQKCIQGSLGATCGQAACDQGTTAPTCQGDTLVSCNGGVLATIDCPAETSAVGDTCGVVQGTAQCIGTGAACDASSTPDTCQGSVMTACSGGRFAHYDCASIGLPFTCQVATGGSATCVAAATECTETTPESCSDGVITYCLWGTITTLDCTSYGLSGCATLPASSTGQILARCLP